MEKLKCESCGANLKVDENNEYASCPYCNLKYKLKKDVNYNIKLELDEDIKEGLKKGGKIAGKVGIVYVIVQVIIFVVVLGIVIFSVSKIFGLVSNQINENNLVEKDVSDTQNTVEQNMFNGVYEMYSGTQSKFFVTSLLENVVTNNKKYEDKKITVIYNDINTTIPDEITSLKQELPDKDYEVVLDYNDSGYIYQITLQD